MLACGRKGKTKTKSQINSSKEYKQWKKIAWSNTCTLSNYYYETLWNHIHRHLQIGHALSNSKHIFFSELFIWYFCNVMQSPKTHLTPDLTEHRAFTNLFRAWSMINDQELKSFHKSNLWLLLDFMLYFYCISAFDFHRVCQRRLVINISGCCCCLLLNHFYSSSSKIRSTFHMYVNRVAY